MKRDIRWLITEVFTGAALSNRALAIFAVFALPIALVTMPFGVGMGSPATWVTAIVAQVVFTLLAIAARPLIKQCHGNAARALRVITIAIAGAVRGAILVFGTSLASNESAYISDYVLRSANSALTSVILLAFIGAVIQYTWNYRADYAVLLDRARRLQRQSSSDQPELPAEVVAQWIGVQRSLRSTADVTRAQLEADNVSPGDFEAAAEVISDVVEQHVRPVSHGLWAVNAHEAPRLRPALVAWDALRPWNPPIAAIIMTTAVISTLGAITRAGVITGGIFALYITASMALLLYASARMGRVFPRTRWVGVLTLALMPVAVVLIAQVIGQSVLRAPADQQGAVISGISASVLIAALVFLRRVSLERAILLDELQARINAQGLDVLAHGDAAEWSRTLGTFVHHSVQAELNAMRLHLIEAAAASEVGERERARDEAIGRLDRLLELQPPWKTELEGRQVIADVASAWEGIAHITLELTSAGTAAQWQVAAQVVQEGVANAIRSGRARTIYVRIEQGTAGGLTVTITDDGVGVPDPNHPGLGTLWLERIAPGAWRRSSTAPGTVLEVCVS